MSFLFRYRPRAAIVARLNRRVYTPSQLMDLHMKYGDAASPMTPQGGLEVKVKFLDEIASKARSLIAERASNVKSCDLRCAQLAMCVEEGLEDVHRHHEDIGPHIVELREKFDDIKSAADAVLRGIDSERSKEAAPFFTPIFWGMSTDAIKKEKDVWEEIRTTVIWIQKAATLVYKVLDEDILPIVPALGALPHPQQVPSSPSGSAALGSPPAISSPSYHTAPSNPASAALGSPPAIVSPSYHTAPSTPASGAGMV